MAGLVPAIHVSGVHAKRRAKKPAVSIQLHHLLKKSISLAAIEMVSSE
jgi:hypothetical protein